MNMQNHEADDNNSSGYFVNSYFTTERCDMVL